MERREFVAAFGAIAAAAAATRASAQTAEAPHAHHSHGAKYKAVLETSSKCVSTGYECLRHCFDMLTKDTSMAECAKATYDLISACNTMASLAGTNSPFTPACAKAVADVCIACKKQCDKFPQYVECRVCGEACQACADECRKIA
jgi:Cys-rich four helix bundle protein (predicted Tat secretion target)